MAITGKWHGCHFKNFDITKVDKSVSSSSEIMKYSGEKQDQLTRRPKELGLIMDFSFNYFFRFLLNAYPTLIIWGDYKKMLSKLIYI